MRARAACRYSVFLILLVLGQEFSLARYSDAPVGPGGYHRQEYSLSDLDDDLSDHDDFPEEIIYSSANLQPLPGDLDSDYSDLTDKDFEIFDDKDSQSSTEIDREEPTKDDQDDSLDKEDKDVGKRGAITIILLGTVLAAQLADVFSEVYFKIRGCCDFYPDACKYQKIFYAERNKMIKQNKKIDDIVLLDKNLLTDINGINGNIGTIMQKIRVIMQLEENLIRKLDPKITQQFAAKWKEIQALMKLKNSTVNKWAYKDLSIRFDSAFDSVKGTIFVIGGLASWLLQPIVTRIYNRLKYGYIDKQLTKSGFSNKESPAYKELALARDTKSAKVLGYDKTRVSVAVKDARTAKLNSKMNGVVPGKWSRRLASAMKWIGIASAVASIAFSTYKIISKFTQCSKIARNAKSGAENILKANAQLSAIKRNVTDYAQYLSRVGVTYIRKQLSNERFLKTLSNVKALLVNAGRRSLNNRRAAAAIESYLMNIKTAPFTQTFNRTEDLMKALISVQFIYKCLINKVKLTNYVIFHCKLGNKKLTALFREGIKTWNTAEKRCVDKSGLAYFTLANARVAVTKAFKGTKYYTDCLLNSAGKQMQICRLMCRDGYSATVAASKAGLTISQTTIIYKNCPTRKLTTQDKKVVCKFRTAKNMTDAEIHKSFPCVLLAEIKALKC